MQEGYEDVAFLQVTNVWPLTGMIEWWSASLWTPSLMEQAEWWPQRKRNDGRRKDDEVSFRRIQSPTEDQNCKKYFGKKTGRNFLHFAIRVVC